MSTKYPRTYHYPFSPGTSSDDRINHQYWNDVIEIPDLLHTEKLDGENNCINQYGVFARSHATPSDKPWTNKLRQKWQIMKHDLGDLEIFGENLYAIHSIEYKNLRSDFYVFAMRYNDCWLSWEEVQFFSAAYDFPTVPIIFSENTSNKLVFENKLLLLTNQISTLDSYDTITGQQCTMEGIVSRNAREFTTDEFSKNVFKWVRKGHVKTDEHWTRNWKKANIIYT